MIGAEYAQFASFIPSDSVISQQESTRYLSPYLLPTFSVPHPWTKDNTSAGFKEDFIMVAEFSEIEGPKPVMMIPKDGGQNFDQNTFAVKIMAVDHQANTVGFSISEDTQVVISEEKDGIYGFVHHFVLYDNQARGFVRPFCMAYVTTERRKIMTVYEEMSAQFRKVARFLKYGNRMVFVRDLERYLDDLVYTKSQLRMKKTSPHSDPETNEERKKAAEEEMYKDLQNIRSSMTEVNDILSILRPLLNDRRVECRFQTLENRATNQKMKIDATVSDTISLSENWVTEEKDATETFKCGSFSEGIETSLNLFQRKNTYNPKIVPADRKKRFDSALRGIHELCSWGAKEGLKKLRCIQEHYKRETMILEIERSESNLLDPPGSLMTCGRCVTSNFLTGISMRGLDLSSSLANTLLSSPASEIMKRWPSSDTLDSFKSVGSFVSIENEDDIISLASAEGICTDTPTSPSSKPASPTITTTKPVIQRLGSSCDSESTSSVYHTDEASSTADPPRVNNHTADISPRPSITGLTELYSNQADKNSSVSVSCGQNASVSDTHSSRDCTQKLVSRQLSGETSSECSVSPSQYIHYTDRQAELQCMASMDCPPSLDTRYMGSSQEDTSGDTQPSTSSGDETGLTSTCPPSKKPKAGLYSLGDLIEKLGPGMPGHGIVDVLGTYNNLQHIIYSLLIGRTVLVVGSPRLEREVTRLVTALAVFLPDHRRKHPSMVEWLSKSLKLSDLARIKLAGVCRPEKRVLESVVPSVVKKYSSIIDLDKQVSLAPKYQGSIVTTLLAKRKVFNSDKDFVACIHCWLMEISSKAFIFYHSFCLGNAGSIMYDYSLQRQKEQYRSTVRSFIAKLGIGDHDHHIVEYLAEIVKISEIEPHLRQTVEGGHVARPINLNYLPCKSYPLRY